MGFDNYFNYEFFISAEPSIIGDREPDFTTTRWPSMEFMGRLRREPDDYCCAVCKYAYSIYNTNFSWSNNCLHWLSKGQEIYTLSFWANRRRHIITKERWHKYCWETLRDPMIEAGVAVKKAADDLQAQQDFELAKWRSEHPKKQGKRTVQESLGISDEQAVVRKKTLAQVSVYKSRLTKYVTMLVNSSLEDKPKVIVNITKTRDRINNLNISLQQLGGLPGTKLPIVFTPYDAVTQSSLANKDNEPDYYNAFDREHYYEGGDYNTEDYYEN